MSEPRYHINVFWSEDDRVWVADLPGCTTHGHSPQQAVVNAADAIEGWLEVAREDGLPIPPASYRPFIYQARFADAA